MPTIVPGYVYSLFAALIVGVIVVATCGVVTSNIKSDAQIQQLKNIEQYVATQILNLISNVQENQSSSKILDIPLHIGNQPFWIRISNDSDNAFIETGFGTQTYANIFKEELPIMAVGRGSFTSNLGQPFTQCSLENGKILIYLGSLYPYSGSTEGNKAALNSVNSNNPTTPTEYDEEDNNQIRIIDAGNSVNGLWCKVSDNPQNVADHALEGGITFTMLMAGRWHKDRTIESFNEPSNWIKQVKAIAPNIKVLAWILWSPDGAPDLSTKAYRQEAIDAAVSFVNSNQYDGLNCDLFESWYAPKQSEIDNYAAYINGVHAQLSNQSPAKYTTCETWSDPYPEFKIDYVCPMMYGTNNWSPEIIATEITELCEGNSSPVLAGLMVETDEPPTIYAFADVLSGISTALSNGKHELLAGFSLWEFDTITSNDWTIWKNWLTIMRL